ncbi:MAG TPA: transglycosylase SLT domain-containing protein [Burkholderiales bacterium]|jgi:soluble lytic murein transglycosylase|nr:transglycosylase SLT domain-containing protein [Burkholderiales bacterium]
MIFKHFRYFSAVLALVAAPAAHAAYGADDSLLAAFDAYRAGDAIKFSRHAKKLNGHVLEPWVEYWRTALRLEDAQTADVSAFLAAHADTYVAERLRGDWIKVLGKRRDWQEFEAELANYPREDLEIRCYAWLSRLARNDETAAAEAQAMWLEPRDLPKSCDQAATLLWERGRISTDDVWQRVRALFANGQITSAKEALGYLAKAEAPDERALAEAARHPKRLLVRLPKNMERRATREVVVLAAIRHARNEPEAAAAALEGPLGARLPEADVRYLWGRIGFEAARVHHHNALKWYARAGDTRLDDEQLAWKARAALRRSSWTVVADAIDRMSLETRREPAWIYWYGRALAEQGQETGSRAYFLRIAGQTDFYGLLADEELGYVATVPEATHVPSEEDIEKAKRNPGLARALELIRLGMRTEGVREWLYTIRYFDDAQLIAAAELARRAEVYDRAIHTADKTQRSHNFNLRYPVRYPDVFRDYARTHGLDEAWVLGLVRQESRFIADARSSAGAAGLMQIMPRTARYVASKIGLRNYRPKDVTHVQTNVGLGTSYLKMVLDQLGHPVLASAAYNAGPARARRWRDAKPLEGAIYAETIPFGETRDYVKKVMANAVFYSALVNHKLTPLKTLLGTVPARGAGEPVEEEELP